MALKSWLASLKKAEVSEVSSNGSDRPIAAMPGGADTPDTPPKGVRYQPKPNAHAGCTPDTSDTPEKINVEAEAKLLDLAMKWAEYTGDGEEARRRWREDVEATPQALRAGLAKYLQEQIRAARANGYGTRRPVPAMCRSFG